MKITTGRDYNNIYKNGKRYTGRYIIMYIWDNTLKKSRFGIVASKKVGKAVARNRIKRQIRQILQNNIEFFGKKYDIVVIARYNIYGIDSKKIEHDLMLLAKKGGLC